MKLSFAMPLFALLALPSFAQPQHVDLGSLFDTETVTGAEGSALSPFIDEEDGSVDQGTLPGVYIDGEPAATTDGRASFLFAPLSTETFDALAVDGQTLDVNDGNFASLDLAFLSAPGGYVDPFRMIRFVYADGSEETARFSPIAGWQTSPSAYDNIFLSFTDDSTVEIIDQFDTLTDDEQFYLLQEQGSNSNGAGRFIDGTGFALYAFDTPADLQEAKLGITVGNNFKISIATAYFDPAFSTEEGFTVIADSMEIHNGVDHHGLGNLGFYEFDISEFLAEGTQELYVLLTDASPNDGWGPDVRSMQIFKGEVQQFEETLAVEIDPVGDSEIYAEFQTDGNAVESDYLYDNNASGPADRGHRFADGSGFLTYRFDFPDDADDVKLTVDMANNFVVGLSGPTDQVRFVQMTPGSPQENDYLIENTAQLSGNHRFADGNNSMTYRFDLDDGLSEAFAQVNVGNQFIVEIAGADQAFDVVQDWVAETGAEPRDNSNLATYTYDLASYLAGNAENVVYLRFSDGQPADGWGADLYGISIVNQVDSGTVEYETVLDSMAMFGEDVHNEYNKDYYTIDLAPVLANNPGNEVFVRFSDGSTGDGWGPGVFWMAAYSGEIDIHTDRNVFEGLKSTTGTPANINAGLNYRRYALDSGKTLSEIQLPSQSAIDEDVVYLLGATLNPSGTDINDWAVFE